MKTETRNGNGFLIEKIKNNDGSTTTVIRRDDGSFEMHQVNEYDASDDTNLSVDIDLDGCIRFCAASDGYEKGSIMKKDLPLFIELLSRTLRLKSEK